MSSYSTAGARKLGKAKISPLGSLQDQELARLLEGYRTAVAGRYAPVSAGEIHDRIGGGPWWISTKLDGELWFVSRGEEETILVAPNGRVIFGNHPIIDAAATLPTGTVLAGELHVQLKGRRGRVGDVGLALNGAAKAPALEFAAFDVVSADGINIISAFEERLSFLNDNVPAKGVFRAVESMKVESTSAIQEHYSSTVVDGAAEGLVVRSSDGRTYKIKPSTDLDAVIIAYTERMGERDALEIRSVLVALQNETGNWVQLCSVGNLGDSAARATLHERLQAITAPSAYRHASDGIIYRFVQPTVVAEIRVGDIQPDDARGRRLKQPLLSFDAKSGWRAVDQVNSAAALSPVLQRIRDDKLPTARDVGWDQLEPFLNVADPNDVVEHGPSQVIRREVWIKRAADKTDVRKLLVWKTNKEQTGRFPAYVVHWTDYSSTRKSPLNREVRLAPSEAEALRLAELMVADGVKKGWERVT